MKVVEVLDGDSACSVKQMFQKRGWNVQGVDTDSPADLVVFTGGADVSPSLYGEENTASYCDPARDAYEQGVFEAVLLEEVPMVGICRGGQFLHVMNGGKMAQNLKPRRSGVLKSWRIDVYDEDASVHLDHHQGMLRDDTHHSVEVLVYNWEEDGYNYYDAVFYPKTKCLCFQPHPEWGHKGTEDLFFGLMNEYLGV